MSQTLKQNLARLRHNLGLVFDDDLGTRKWYNIADWLILFMIMLSAVEIFVTTFPVGPQMAAVLDCINNITLWFFVVEVTLRIWAAPEQSPRFRGIRGRLRYCLTFYGFIDFVSTYPFLIQFFVPLPVGALKVLRTARMIRILRITRYAKSFNLLTNSIREKRNELIVSTQFLLIITFILSLMLYFYEHEAQPEAYGNGFSSAIWAFAQYIGDPGQFAETPPTTIPGKIIAVIVGLLGIAIVAVPAGILGAGFTETIEKEARRKQVKTNAAKLRSAFERKLDRPTGYQSVPFFRSLADLQARLQMTSDELIEAIDHGPGFRLINLASTVPVEQRPLDRLAVEHFATNRPYGQLIDRGSAVTIVSPSSLIDASVGLFAYYVAKIGGFNFISREYGATAPYQSFYAVKDELTENQAEYNADLERLMDRPGAWSFTMLAASGANEPEYPTQVHLGFGAAKGDETLDAPGVMVSDKQCAAALRDELTATLRESLQLATDSGRFHSTAAANLWPRRLNLREDSNHVVMRIAWSAMLWSGNRLLLAKAIADTINRVVLECPTPNDPTLTVKAISFD